MVGCYGVYPIEPYEDEWSSGKAPPTWSVIGQREKDWLIDYIPSANQVSTYKPSGLFLPQALTPDSNPQTGEETKTKTPLPSLSQLLILDPVTVVSENKPPHV